MPFLLISKYVTSRNVELMPPASLLRSIEYDTITFAPEIYCLRNPRIEDVFRLLRNWEASFVAYGIVLWESI